jgi:hypothetical protein
VKLLDQPTHDGARQFARLPQTTHSATLRDHLAQLPGVKVRLFLDSVAESWIEFELEGHAFSINDQFGEYWFFVTNPNAPEELLERVVSHAVALLGDPTEGGRHLELRGAAFGYGLCGAVLGVLILRVAHLSWGALAAAGLALYAGTWWLARIILLKRLSMHGRHRSRTGTHSGIS